MNGRMKSFVEDMIISIVVIIIIAGLYYVVSNFVLDKEEVIPEEKTALVIEDKKIEEQNTTTIIEDEIEKEIIKEDSVTIEPIDINETNNVIEDNVIEDEKETISTIEEELINSTKEKKVDRKKLNQFIDNVEDEIAKNINYNLDENSKEQEEFLKIRVTLLKSGDYEQLTFVDGNEELFEKNKENILKTFPVSINKDIIEEFPRYLRIELKTKF
jgi:hypothetical protein